MGQSDNVIPGGVDLGAQAAGSRQVSGKLNAAQQQDLAGKLHRLFPPKAEEADGVKNLDELLELMTKVARGDSEYGAVQLSPQACRELLDRVTNAQQLATVANRDKEQALARQSQVEDAYRRSFNHVENERDQARAARDSAYVKLAQAHEEITGLRTEVGELRFALESTRKERDDLAERLADLSELVLEDADASAAASGDGEPPRHLHCCECEQCQPPQRGCIIINVFRAEGHCPTINVGGKGD